MDRNEEMRKSKKKKKRIKMICIIMAVVIAVVFCVPFDFKYIKKKSKQGGIDFSTFELVERSTTPDDSVCVVSDIDKEGKEYFEDNKSLQEYDVNNCFIPQRLSSNKIATFKIDISQRTFDLFTLLETHFTGYKFKLSKIEELKRNAYKNPYFPGYDVSRIDSVKAQYYDIDKNKVTMEEDVLKEIRKNCHEKEIYGIRPYSIMYSKNRKTGKWDIKYGFFDIGYYHTTGILRRTGNGYQDDERFKHGRAFYTEDIYENNYDLEKSAADERGYMNPSQFYELLKESGVAEKYVTYTTECDEWSYDDADIYLMSEGLPDRSAKLYKIYPKLKQFIGKKNKLVSFFIKGVKN
ncbi:hypothetical protein [Lachnobacterium bovis]|uniref:hypothetical protein n=1 Tax=Lachnobacterium bovis TaxID=140626 RepID=UPI00048C49DE|nr:hypothetical protein [Lachnobacterium bovis]